MHYPPIELRNSKLTNSDEDLEQKQISFSAGRNAVVHTLQETTIISSKVKIMLTIRSSSHVLWNMFQVS